MGNTFKTGNYVNGIFQDTSNNIGIGAAPSGTYKFEITGTSKVSGVLTLGATLSNGTYTYTLPAATGTLALVGGAGVGTVTSVAALTIGTTGTDLSSTVANSTTTPVITLNVPTASAANRGALSSADWTTFNNKQSALTNPITGTGTNNKVPKFTSTGSTIGDSAVTDNGTNVLLTSRNIILTNTATAQFYIESNNGAYSPSINAGGTGNGLGYTTGQMYFANPSNVITFNTKASSAESMRIDASGNVGIGTVSPQATYKVTISGTDTIFPAIYLENTTNTQAYSIRATGTNFLVRDNTSGNDRFTIASTGAATFSSNQIGATGLIITNSSTDTTASAVARFNNSGSNVTYIGLGSTARTSYINIGANILSMYTDNAAGMSFLVDANGPMSFATNSTTRLTIASTGNVGIGTATASNKLTVSNAANGIIASFTNTVDADFAINLTSGVTLLTPSTGTLAFGTGLTERMRITSGGNVLIGTTTDDTVNKLQVNGNIAINKGAGNTAIFDTNNTRLSLALGGTANFTNFSGMILVNSYQTGSFQILVCGGGSTASVYLLGGAMGTLAYNAGINGYTYTITAAATSTYNFTAFRTRPDA